MIPLDNRIAAFSILGKILHSVQEGNQLYEYFDNAVKSACTDNPWFIYHEVWDSLRNIGRMLKEDELLAWVSKYNQLSQSTYSARKVGVVMAGNIPAVGFHDMLCVLMAGHCFYGKPATGDKRLLDAIARMIIAIEPDFKNFISFHHNFSFTADMVIATGSNNSYRYFNYYFGNLPHIFRKNRNSVAIITGNETEVDLNALGKDIFTYCGLGCRNVSSLFLFPEADPDRLLTGIHQFGQIIDHQPYQNSYRFQKALLKMNNTDFYDNGFVLMAHSKQLASPVGVLHYSLVQNPKELEKNLENHNDQIQCIVAGNPEEWAFPVIQFGKAQQPTLLDYTDGIDTMEFLLS